MNHSLRSQERPIGFLEGHDGQLDEMIYWLAKTPENYMILQFNPWKAFITLLKVQESKPCLYNALQGMLEDIHHFW